MSKKSIVLLLFLVAACGGWLAAAGQERPPAKKPGRSLVPDTFSNLQVLPKDIAKDELVEIMRNFCFTMNQRCSYCHVATDDLSFADFPNDEKETKRKARELLRLILAAKKVPAAQESPR